MLWRAVVRDAVAAALGVAGASAWTAVCVALSWRRSRRGDGGGLTRKLLHVVTAPVFMLTTPLYSRAPTARLFAAAVPAIFAVRLRRAARRTSADALGGAVARVQGNVAEAAGGPLFYAVAVSSLVLVAWRERSSMYIAVGALAFGDGAADVFGSTFPVASWPLPKQWPRKSVGGTAAFVACGTAGSLGLTRLMEWGGILTLTQRISAQAVLAVVTMSAAVELLPLEDNLTVPATALLLTEVALRLAA
jgi:dolichol kinase